MTSLVKRALTRLDLLAMCCTENNKINLFDVCLLKLAARFYAAGDRGVRVPPVREVAYVRR